jgi:drug/metabolite transporter (DMT)-like permease
VTDAAGNGRPAAAFAFAPWLAGGLSILIWGATPAATKFAVRGIDAFAVGGLRTVIAGAVVLPALILLRLPLPGDRRGWMLLAISSISGFVAFPVLFSLALAYTSTAHAGLILAPLPILTGLIGAVVERRMPGVLWWGGVALAFAGEAVLVGLPDAGSGEATLLGDLLAFAAGLSVAGGYVAGSRLSPSIGTWSVTAWGAVLGAGLMLPVVGGLSLRLDWSGAGAAAWGATLYLAIFSSLLAYVAWYWALAAGGIARISLLQFIQPVVTLILAVLLFGEVMTAPLLLSAAFILFGVAIARRG